MPRGNDPGQRLRSPGAPTARRRLPGRVPRTLRCPERFETRLRHAAAPHNPIGDELQLIDLERCRCRPARPRYNRVSARMTTTPRAGARVEEIVHRHVDAQCSTPPSRRICPAPNILVALRTAQASGSDRSCRRFIPHDRRPRVAGGTERAIRRPHCHHGRRRGIESKPISE